MKRMTKEVLIRKGDEFFLDHGYETPLDEFCKAAKVSKKTIYKHFGSKEELIKSIFIYRQQIIENFMIEVPEDGSNALSLMISNNLRLRSYMKPDEQRKNYLFIQANYPETFAELMKGVEQVIMSKLVPIVEQGIEEGVILPHLNPQTVSTIYKDFFLTSRTTKTADSDTLDTLTDSSVLMFLRSLLTPKGFKIYEQEQERLQEHYVLG